MKNPALGDFWEKTLGVIARAQDEIVKVSQMGKTQIDRSFLKHERSKLYQKLGEMVYQSIKEEKIKLPDTDRLTDQIDRLSKRINEMGDQVKDLTQLLSFKLDAEQETDLRKEVSRKKFLRKKKDS